MFCPTRVLERQPAPELATALYVFVALTAFGFLDALGTHRVATDFDTMVALRVMGASCVFAVLAGVAGRIALVLDALPRARSRDLMLGAAVISATGFVADEPTSTSLIIAVLGLATASLLWSIVPRSSRGLHWIAWLPVWGIPLNVGLTVAIEPSIWLRIEFAAIVALGISFAESSIMRLPKNLRRAAVGGLSAVGCLLGIAASWSKLGSVYRVANTVLVLTTTAVIAPVVWRAAADWRPGGLARLSPILVGGALTFGLFVHIAPRADAYGPSSAHSLVGHVTRVAHPLRPVATPETLGAEHACADETQPAGVIWVMIDTLRADHFTAEEHPVLAEWAPHTTTFTHAYSAANATYPAFATWIPKRPDQVGIPFQAYSTSHAADLNDKLGADTPNLSLGDVCSGEGVRFTEHLDELEPRSLALLYMPVAHAPYRCTEPGQDDAACYREAVRCVADELEAVFDWAKQHPEWAVIITSDHGESFGEKGAHYHGTGLWEEQIRVPLLVRGPGFVRGDVVDTPVSNARISGTLGCWLGRDPALLGGPAEPLTTAPSTFVVHGFTPEVGPRRSVRRTAVIDWPYKLILDRDTDYARLVDLEVDPRESTNLADEQPERVQAMTTMMASHWPPPTRSVHVQQR